MFSITPDKPYIIAEIGCNHNGDMALAKKLVDEAKKAGCDAVKFQLWGKYTAHTKSYIEYMNENVDSLESAALSNPELGLKNVEEQLEAFKFEREEHIEIKAYCDKVGIDFSSTCLTEEDVDFLIDLKVDFLKIASQDLNHLQFIEYIASKNYPTLLSVGLGNLKEIEAAVNCFKPDKLGNLALMHVISLYPPEDSSIHLNSINTLRNLFKVPVGYSDHSIGFSIPLAAVAKGAMIIEKHFTLDKEMPGWDHKVSADPEELKIICSESVRVMQALGDDFHELNDREKKKKEHFRRSIVTKGSIKAGERITSDKVFFKRPGTGISPDELKYVLNRVAKNDIPDDELIQWNDLV